MTDDVKLQYATQSARRPVTKFAWLLKGEDYILAGVLAFVILAGLGTAMAMLVLGETRSGGIVLGWVVLAVVSGTMLSKGLVRVRRRYVQ